MRIIAMILGLSLASITTVADDHGGKMALEARQPDSTMNVTSCKWAQIDNHYC